MDPRILSMTPDRAGEVVGTRGWYATARASFLLSLEGKI
jgi:hypothetical protein